MKLYPVWAAYFNGYDIVENMAAVCKTQSAAENRVVELTGTNSDAECCPHYYVGEEVTVL